MPLALFLALALVGCASAPLEVSSSSTATYQRYELKNPPLVGRTSSGQEIRMGGFSGLVFLGRNADNGRLQFLTHTDRGPNTFPLKNADKIWPRPFLLPNFNPEWIRLELDSDTKNLVIISRTPLKRKTGKAITGLPNHPSDEPPVDPRGKPLAYDRFGVDTEAVTLLPDGTIWMGEEYRPSLLLFSADGVLRDRLVPMGTNSPGVKNEYGTEALPAHFSRRQLNRGFEGIAHQNGKIYAFMQSPLDKDSLDLPVVEYDLGKEAVTAEFIYPVDSTKSDKIGDVASVGDGEFLVIERDGDIGPTSAKKLYFASIVHGSQRLKKNFVLDLTRTGFDMLEKAEGLAVVDENTIALVNDNDFALDGAVDPATGLVKMRALGSYLFLVTIPEGIHHFAGQKEE